MELRENQELKWFITNLATTKPSLFPLHEGENPQPMPTFGDELPDCCIFARFTRKYRQWQFGSIGSSFRQDFWLRFSDPIFSDMPVLDIEYIDPQFATNRIWVKMQ
jgi:hypothetical protein